MTIEDFRIRRIQGDVEAAGSFAVDTAGAGAFDVPAIEGTVEMSLGQPMLDPQTIQTSKDGYPIQVPGLKNCTLSFQTVLAPTGTAASTGVTAVTAYAISPFLKAAMGGQTKTIGKPCTGGTQILVNVTSTTAMNVVEGTFIGMNEGASSEYVIRMVRSVASGTDINLALGLNSTATTGLTVYGCVSHYMAEDPATSLQFLVEGEESTDKYLLRGMQLDSLSFDFTLGELPKATWGFKGVAWAQGAGGWTGSGGSLSDNVITFGSQISPVVTDGEFKVMTSAAGGATYSGATTAITNVDISSFSLEPSITYTPQASPSGTGGVARWVRTKSSPTVTGTFTPYFEDTTYLDYRDNTGVIDGSEVTQGLFFQIGNAAGKSILIALPSVQITDVQMTDLDGLMGQTVSFSARRNKVFSGTTDEETKSPMYIVFG